MLYFHHGWNISKICYKRNVNPDDIPTAQYHLCSIKIMKRIELAASDFDSTIFYIQLFSHQNFEIFNQSQMNWWMKEAIEFVFRLHKRIRLRTLWDFSYVIFLNKIELICFDTIEKMSLRFSINQHRRKKNRDEHLKKRKQKLFFGNEVKNIL